MDNYTFFSDGFSFEYKSSTKKYYVEGYISTKEKDLYNDIVTEECLNDLVKQLNEKNIKLDIDHEAWNKSSRLIPIGRIIDAKRDEKGIYVRAEINKSKKQFKEAWSSIKNKFLDAFSIAYKVIKMSNKVINEEPVRLLEKIDLVNVAITGNPVNPNAKMMKVFTKSMKKEDKEDTKMSENETEQKGEGMDYKKKYEEMKAKYEEMEKEVKALKEKAEKKESDNKEGKEEKEEKEDKKDEEKSKKSVDSESADLEQKSLNKQVLELKSIVESKNQSITELKSRLDSLEKEPQLKSVIDKLNEVEKKSKEQEKPKGAKYLF